MLIDISDDVFFSGPEISFFEEAVKCRFLEKVNDSYKLSNEIYKNLRFDDEIFINPYWAGFFCQTGGTEKGAFIALQVEGYELKEAFERGEIEITIRKDDIFYEFDWLELSDRDGRTTKEMIKYYKKHNPQSSAGCKYIPAKLPDYHIRLCCVCGNKEKKIARKK
jgi:hypothetical protein